MRAVLRPAAPEDVAIIAAGCRAEDVAELWASCRITPERCMADGMRFETVTAELDGVPVCMFGIVPMSWLGGVGVPWMVGTDGMRAFRAQRELLRLSRPALEALAARYDHLVNWVDARNTASVRWLGWLGFKIHAAEPFGPDRIPFHRFDRRA